ncbi:MAG: hypothetical protein NXI23_09590 [Bacteroidetes bacterium]|jgi:phage shock protein A|nr:hypothetical protein [Bacteroidota bacterium]MDF1866015.1 hypothetical protein [Saprospiraceae bacterium]
MSDIAPQFKKKSFWQRPEGITGTIFLLAILAGVGFLAVSLNWAVILANTAYMVITAVVIAAVLYMIFDPKMRNLVWYMYKSVMRSVTGIFVQLDPIGILKSYVEDLQDNLGKMSKQIGKIRGQMRKLGNLMESNKKEIGKNMKIASAAKDQGNQKAMLLSSRKAARLTETNEKYQKLHNRMKVMYKILDKMYQNSEILLEDTKDQVQLKEQERKAIRASHSAMKSAMSVISGDPDQRAMFDSALEHIADDLANKVGEMEQFMEMSSNFMDSVDLQNGIFEEEGLKMLEQWEEKSTMMLLGDGKEKTGSLDLNSKVARPEKQARGENTSYDNLFE